MAAGEGGTTPPTVTDGSLNDRAARVFEFLVELQRLRTKVVRSLDAHRSVLWFADLPNAPGLLTPPETADPETHLVVDRVEREAPPTPPATLRPWITDKALRDSSQPQPQLSPRTVKTVEVMDADGQLQRATEEVLLEDHPEVQTALAEWLPTWQAWATLDRPRAAIGEVYHRLYAVYQDTRALAETYELVLSFGCLLTSSGHQEVRRHLITMPVTIELDLDTGRLTVTSSPDAGTPALEQDMLDPEDTVPDDTRQAIRAILQDLQEPWDPDTGAIAEALRTWVNGSGPDATYSPQLAAPTTRTSAAPAAVTFAPALILRERTRRTFIAACEQVIAALRAGADVPSGVRQFAQITDGRVPDDQQQPWLRAYTDDETYFPKPANDEQRQIRARLADHQTVVVQGPPGTGKTHTIANLITDLLAHGQRVLITSTTTRALKVLKDKLPPEISDLCVSVTDDAVKGQADLERSVNTILTQADTWNQNLANSEAAGLRAKLTEARTREQLALTELRSIREQETYVYAPEVGDYTGTLQAIAERIASEEADLSWLGPVPADHPTLSASDVLRLHRLLQQVTDEVRARTGTTPDLTDLPTPAVVDDLTQRRAELHQRSAALADTTTTAEYQALATLDRPGQQQIQLLLADLTRRRAELRRRREPWVADAIQDLTTGRDRTWRQRHADTTTAIETAQPWLPWAHGHVITGTTQLELGAAIGHASTLVEHFNAGGKLKGVFGKTKTAKETAPFLDAVRVNGRPCDDLEHARIAHSHLTIETLLRPIEATWGYPDQSHLPHNHRLAQLHDETSLLSEVLAFGDATTALQQRLRATPGMPPLDPNDDTDTSRLDRVLHALALDALQDDIAATIDPAIRHLTNHTADPAAVAPIHTALTALRGWDPTNYQAAYQDLQQATAANQLVAELDASRQLVAAELPALAATLTATQHDPAWDQRLPHLADAWAWSVWEARIRAKTDPGAEDHWRGVLSVAEFDARNALQQLATNRGWSLALQRLTPSESTHLKMYAQAVRKAGKGTGKYAARYREDARTSLRACQSAVPAWIMPMHQVFATVPVDRPNLFDVVIIDEASQSGLEGLLLSWLAPRMVVVGDDKQVSPSNVGLDHEAVFTLQDRFLTNLEHKSLFGPLSSFFDQAVGMASSRIMLKEHFRCMPEIIGFSNELCYRGELVPLRQYGADRLPPLRTTYVKGALVAGRRDVINEAEADALVAQIEKCCADPAYDGKTMGVITMLGNAQDKLITQRLVDALGVQTVEERQLRAGNAEAFQGDERDVIFISLVSSLQATTGPARIGPWSKESDQQRLNVAASRARDQVWLFHSVQPGDLSGKDLRQRYLQYLLKPPTEQDGLDIGEVRPDQRHPSFDSLFEQRVFLAIRDRGYRVRPQVKVGGYRIDLVIEGGTRRLAVECDGDAFHTGTAELDDAARQRDLERVGWTFWRVRGSAFFRDPQAAMDPLWALLDHLGIDPAWEEDQPETASHTEVDAAPVAALDTADDLVDDLFTASEVLPPPPPTQAPASAPAQPAPIAAPQTPNQPTTPRFRNGKVVLTTTAAATVQAEADAITAWLQNPPPIHAVDARSRQVQLEKQASHRDDLEGRLSYLTRVLAQSIADPQHEGGHWVTPGSRLRLLYPGETEPELLMVSSLPLPEPDGAEAATIVSPFTELGQAIEGAELGATVRFQTPRGLQHATIVEVLD